MNPQPCLPADVLPIVQDVTGLLSTSLGADLLNVTIHGSLALGGFRVETSDIDALVVVARPLPLDMRAVLGRALVSLPVQSVATGLELSVLTVDALHRYRYPLPFELHVSPAWWDQFRAGTVNLESTGTDPDLAAHLTVALHCGVTVYGAPMTNYLSSVPWEDYIDAIVADAVEAAAGILDDPLYGVLNLCRVLGAVTDRVVLSKRDGGLWGVAHLPNDAPLIRTAIHAYTGEHPGTTWDSIALTGFARDTIARIKGSVVTAPAPR